jgi:hypothetical protein
LFAAENGLNMLGVVIEPWGDVLREVILIARKTIDEVLFKESESWMELVAADGVKFKHGEEDEWAMTAVLRGVKEVYTASLYQVMFDIYSTFLYYTNV